METLWTTTHRLPTFPPLEGDVRADVAIVGAGIAGITAALLLKERGRTVALLDAAQPATGETAHTTAHTTLIQDIRYREIASRLGRERAAQVARSGAAAIDMIEHLAASFGGGRFERVPGYVYAESEDDLADLEAEARTARVLGLDAELTRHVPLPYPVAGGVRFARQAQIDPLDYLAPVLRAIPGHGSHVFGGSRVRRVAEGARTSVVRTAHGSVRARHVLVLTHAPFGRVLIHTRVVNHRTYVLAARVEAPLGGLFYDTAEPYHYVRTQRTDRGIMLIVGGEDHVVGDVRETEHHHQRLEAWARARFPFGEVDLRWSGQVVDSVDSLPFIGRERLASRTYMGTGFTGTGMVNGTLAAMILADQVTGRNNPWSATYSPRRLRLRAQARELVSHNVHVARRFVGDRVGRPEVDSLEALPRGEGALTSVGGRKLAVYRDEAGAVHALSPVCTHMGCLVQWNAGERSWDCPCHGSRYDVDGQVLNGPAVRALARVDVTAETPPPG